MGVARQRLPALPASFWCGVIFVIAMAGESRRFLAAGYGAKFMLPLAGAPLFDHAVSSFADYFNTAGFLFVLRPEAEDFARARCRALGVASTNFIALERPTAGQAESVLLGLDAAAIPGGTPVTIFNIDTFRPGYRAPPLVGDGDLEVFEGQGDNWSFVAPDPACPGRVRETSEKRTISRLCCTGLYRFTRADDFRWAFHNPTQPQGDAERQERYVAPLYNALIGQGRDIRYTLIERDAVIFCGTPEEYEGLKRDPAYRDA
jgi:MobA-like NTP transferase domain